MEIVQIIAISLAAVGAVNWGLGPVQVRPCSLIAGGMSFGTSTSSRESHILSP